jgi:hypothetical protein
MEEDEWEKAVDKFQIKVSIIEEEDASEPDDTGDFTIIGSTLGYKQLGGYYEAWNGPDIYENPDIHENSIVKDNTPHVARGLAGLSDRP